MWAVHNEKEVHIYVSDEGRGVPEELRTAIFERFKQVDQSDSHKGTGLGLAICKMIVDSHGGEIGVRVPELGKGSEFWFTVPQEAVVPVPDSQPA